jgi:carbonic anhydrase/acetyltransferase-like protein (isoleucine patch superfamily)
MKKYRLLPCNESKYGKVFRVQALKSFGCVKKGDIGGMVSGEDNLSHEDVCWIFDEAAALGNAKVTEKAILCGNACVRDNTNICGESVISGGAVVKDFAWVNGNSHIEGGSVIAGYAYLMSTRIAGDAFIGGYANLKDECVTSGQIAPPHIPQGL